MNSSKRVHAICCATSAALLLGGLLLVVTYGFQAPPWLLKAEVATLSLLALVGGFSVALPPLATLLRLRPVRGAAFVALGVAATYLPPQLIASAVFLFFGIRLVWASACELAEGGPVKVEILSPGSDAARLPSPGTRELARQPVPGAAAPACRSQGR